MRVPGLVVCLLWTAGVAFAAPPQQPRAATFLFGPAGAEHGRAAARSAASAARRWLKQPDSTVELRATGSGAVTPVQDRGAPKVMDEMFLAAARTARDSDTAAFLTALDSAAQALARRAEMRVLIAIVDAPPLSKEAEDNLKQIVDYCQSNGVRVIVVDLADERPGSAAEAFEDLGKRSGGSVVHEAKGIENAILLASAGSKPADEKPHAAPTTSAQLPALPSDIPVYTRFVRISSRGSQGFGMERRFSAGPGGISEVTGGAITESVTGPTRGLFLVEAPLTALRFETDDNAGQYQARAKVTQIARDANGKIAWQSSKTVTFRGPLRKLDTRQAGNLYYLREVQLPAGQYTIEAIVEDLIASKSGGIREPLRTQRGVPGFDVSDAMFVRPFNGSADRLEADQTLSYDGDAIAPLLEPAYEAGKPFDLRLYAILYPDVNGAQPELSLELRQKEHVIGRTALPFTDRIRDTATEGKSSMVAEAKHQFPYIATLKGVKLDGGEYEARLLVRQGGTVLTRSARFRVHGAPAEAAIVATAPRPAGDGPDEGLANVVLPEVDPVTVNAGTGVSEEEQRRIWDDASKEALSYTSRLPNFRCDRETRRLLAPVKSADQFSEAGSVVEELTYESGQESYRTLELNGRKSNTDREKLEGVKSRGEFGAMLRYFFRPDISEHVKWAGRAMAGGVLCAVYDVDVPLNKSNFMLSTNLRQAIAPYRGRVMIDEETGLVRRIVMTATSVPKDFDFQSPVMSLEYGMVRIGEQDHLLPLRSVLQLRQGRHVARNETLFRNYRKFEADSQIRFR